jgi:hypothetical protein
VSRALVTTTALSLPARAAAAKAEGGKHIVLLGDSILDNGAYVGDGSDVIPQFGKRPSLRRPCSPWRHGRPGNLGCFRLQLADLVVGLYKLAKIRAASGRDAVIDEGLSLLARLDADGKLSDDQKGWTESFFTLRNGSR